MTSEAEALLTEILSETFQSGGPCYPLLSERRKMQAEPCVKLALDGAELRSNSVRHQMALPALEDSLAESVSTSTGRRKSW